MPLGTDMHSHLLAGLDDGVKSLEEAEVIIREFQNQGYTKLITTPHIMSDHYRNDPDIIKKKLAELQSHLAQKKIEIKIEAAAEYYLDEILLKQVAENHKLLTFGSSYLLFETNFLSEPYQLKDFIFKITTQGYKPVLAHPERYQYMSLEKAEDLRNRGVLFQINMLSLIGHYSKPIQSMAYKFIDRGWIDFLGSDCHNQLHINLLAQVRKNKYFKKALDLPLLNRMI
ncbi:MAG TPA: CpsB/CapC family capsule biosynthesis tyrosine phosphatase [Cyclobacteriaceae bacterium]